MVVFNLFRKVGEIRIHCAVPDGGRLPAFLRGAQWSFEGKVGDLSDRLMEVDRPLYENVIRETGYFIFSTP